MAAAISRAIFTFDGKGLLSDIRVITDNKAGVGADQRRYRDWNLVAVKYTR